MTETLLAGRYRLDEPIGRGGMATVWRATDLRFGRQVAVKRLHPAHLDDHELSERFRREAVVVARLSHPNLVRLLDRGEDVDGPFLVMELIEGETLKARIRREGRLDPDVAAEVCARVADALAYAHRQGVVHRDIKAQNVLLTPEGMVKLGDFGIARLLEAGADQGLTKTDVMVGSADYIAPEQADGRAVDGRTDIYSLGIVLYECLTGEVPYRGEGFLAVAMKHLSEPLPDPRRRVPELPDRLAAVALRACAKDPEARFGTADELAHALVAPSTWATDLLPALPPDGDGDTRRQRRPRRRGRVLVPTLAALAVVLGGGAAAYLTGVLDPMGAFSQEATPLAIADISDFDPEGDAAETPEAVSAALGDPETAWYTERYGTAEFGNLKRGVGLRLTLAVPAMPSELVVSSPTPGADVELLGPPDATGVRPVLGGARLSGGRQEIAVSATRPERDYVLWITSLVPDDDGHFWAGIGEVILRGTANGQR